ncbi:MAG TPA: thioredoxin [Minicystis sp.]|nr:thioredoxin [Minicystis sp.]
MSEAILELNDMNFDQEVLASEAPVLVDFTAAWCGPCKALAPVLEQLAREAGGAFKIGKLDVDDAPATAARFGVRAMPTLLVFRKGARAAQHVGLANKAKILELLRA